MSQGQGSDGNPGFRTRTVIGRWGGGGDGWRWIDTANKIRVIRVAIGKKLVLRSRKGSGNVVTVTGRRQKGMEGGVVIREVQKSVYY